MGTNNIRRTSESPHPMYGIRPGFNISDLDSSAAEETVVFTNITTAQLSAVFSGARFLSIITIFSSANTSCNIDLYTWNGTAATLVYTFTGASSKTQDIFMGGFEGVDLQGGDFKIGVSNIVNASNISVSYRVNG